MESESRSSGYSVDFPRQAVRLVGEARAEHDSEWAAITWWPPSSA
ncbi:MAG: hypothetical protein ACXV5Q_11475 [Frankiaceae bacterium]